MRRGGLFWLWGSVLVLCAAGRSFAAGDDAEALISHGVELRKNGQDREALVEFERAAKIQRTPRVVAQIALAEMALGSWVPAEEHLLEALAHPDDAWIKKNRPALDRARANGDTHLGTLEVWGTPAGAEVAIDGRVAGTLPLPKPLRLIAGQVTVTVRAAGFHPVTRALQVDATELVREHVELSPVAATPVHVELAARNEDASDPAAGIARKANEPAPAPAKEESHRWWLWTIVGAVVVGGAVATIAILGSRDHIPPCPAMTDCPRQ